MEHDDKRELSESINEQLLRALELEKVGEWDAAHAIAQQIKTFESFQVHAYLHRKEGDFSNARYWYERAGLDVPDMRLEEEWQRLCAMLSNNNTEASAQSV